MAVFRQKVHFAWRKSATKFVWILSATKLSGIHWPIYPCKNNSRGKSPTTWKFGRNWRIPSKIPDFQSIFARRASPV